jgi:predicted nucleotidyltransferase
MQPSSTRNGFWRGSSSWFVDQQTVRECLRAVCRSAQTHLPAIEEVYLFGSYANGTATVRSDADLLVVLAQSPHPRRMDRIPELLEAFSDAPVPVDVVPWTRAELDQAGQEGNRWLGAVMSHALRLWP